MKMGLSVKTHNDMLFNTTVLPIFVVNDRVSSDVKLWDAEKFERKLKFLQLFFLNQVYGISTESINEEVEAGIKQSEFVLKTKEFLKSVPRSP